MLLFPVHAIGVDGRCTCASACGSPGKHPRTSNGWRGASSDPAQHTAWARAYPQTNWGVPTGSANGYWVLDVDGPEGYASLAALEAANGPLPATLDVLTGGGGLHKYFLWPSDGGVPIRNSASKLAVGLDVRGEGGYVLIPPSNHASGGAYLWLNQGQPIAPAPDWLLALVRGNPPAALPVPTTLTAPTGSAAALSTFATALHRLRTAREGTRNATLNTTAHTIAGLLAAGGLDVPPEDARDQIRAAALDCGLEDVEIEKSLDSGFSSGASRPLVVGFRPSDAGFEQTRAAQTTYDSRFRLSADGLRIEHHESPSPTEDPSDKDWRPVFTRIDVVADVRDFDDKDWASVVVVTDRTGKTHQWVMPASILSGDGAALRERLLSLGFRFLSGRSEKVARSALNAYLMSALPTERARVVNRLGWHGGAFIFPDGCIGEVGDERVLIRDSVSSDHAFRVKGTLKDWQQHVAAPCLGNSRFELALSTAFAAPLLALAGLESGGVHLRGVSSSGKSTALRVAGSVWGGGGISGYRRSWRSTDNGLESVAAMHNDALLCLDELSEADPKAAAASAYMLSNGSGKTRAGRTGEGRKLTDWRLLFLSTGEIGIEDKIGEEGRHRRATAGQAVRVLDIPIDARAGYGAFDCLGAFPTAEALAVALGRASDAFYGTAARSYLSWLTTRVDLISARLQGYIPEFTAKRVPVGADPQVARAARRFALIAFGGELAIEAGVLPWPKGSAERGAARCFEEWVHCRGGTTSHELSTAIAAVRGFVEAHGASRFEAAWESNGNATVPNRAGFRKRDSVGAPWTYYIFTEVWKNEVCRGLDPVRTARDLAQAGVLVADAKGRSARSVYLPNSDGRSHRMYCVRAGDPEEA